MYVHVHVYIQLYVCCFCCLECWYCLTKLASLGSQTLHEHCTAISLVGEAMICTEDPKRSIGLWHGVMTAAYNGLHVVYVPPNVMSTLPTAWLHMIHKHKGTVHFLSRTHTCLHLLAYRFVHRLCVYVYFVNTRAYGKHTVT